MVLRAEGLDDKICEMLNIWSREPPLEEWRRIVQHLEHPQHRVSIGIVGKYVDLAEKLQEPARGAGPRRPRLQRPRSTSSTSTPSRSRPAGAEALLGGLGGVLVPGGFGLARQRGQDRRDPLRPRAQDPVPRHLPRHADGRLRVRAPRRRHRRGPQHRVRPLARRGRDRADGRAGGRGRQGRDHAARRLRLRPRCADSLAARIYGRGRISERHRHRYEVNNRYREKLEASGLVLSGLA